MISERENILSFTDYNIAGNPFRVYYDKDENMVLVLDQLISDIKPNVLLVINPDENRKWDDILENDYGVDLETVRPKKDNKYQKLDIEYSGLDLYENLVGAYNDGIDITDDLNQLNLFRRRVAKRVATERLENAEVTAENARETISKANEKISELQEKLKTTRGKLADARRNIGKEPTKQSAAKILRMESQIDAVGEQIKRAKKRIQNAQRRELAAQDEIDIAQKILAMVDDAQLPTTPVATDVAVKKVAPVPAAVENRATQVVEFEDEINEPKADKMADDDVKPLFDTDPEILDEEIAFKPIEFKVPASDAVKYEDDDDAPDVAPVAEPIDFVPPVQPVAEETVEYKEEKPALDVFSPIQMDTDAENGAVWGKSDVSAPVEQPKAEIVVPAANEVAPIAPEVAVAPIVSETRPVSPVVPGAAVSTPAPVVTKQQPTMLYYVMLIALIVLSIFTLWLYQKSSNKALPELGANQEVVQPVEPEQTLDDADVLLPFVETEPVEVVEQESVVVEPEPVVEEEPVSVEEFVVVEPEPVVEEEPVAESAPVVEEEPAPVVEEPAPVVEEPVEIVETNVVTEEEVLLDKPAYNVSQNDKMFVAPHDYETDTPVETVIETCADGNAPDADGCCAGESLMQLPDGSMACCSEGTGECFPPML